MAGGADVAGHPGLRPVFREMGKRLAAQGYVVLVPNPYYRAKKAPVVEGAFDFNSKDDMAKIMAFKAGLTDAMVDRDSAAYITFLDAQPQTDKRSKAGVQGYCMSGPIAFRTAAAGPTGSARSRPSTRARWSPTSRRARTC